MKMNIDNLINSSKNINIMIVDECKETVSYLINLLEEFFGNISVAYDGQEALHIYKNLPMELKLYVDVSI